MALKWKGLYDSGKKYSKAWESKFSWVSKASDGTENAFCKLCHTTIKLKTSNLTNHEKSTKHMQRVKLSTTMKPIQVVRTPRACDELKTTEIKLAVSVACHSALLTIDYLGKVISRNATGSKLEDLKLHRWKCTKILTNVVAPALKGELIADVKGRKFSLIVDETMDYQTTVQAKETILTAFVDLVSLVHTCADDIFNAIKECLAGIDLKLEDCVGYGSDGASVMVGEHDSVWTRILAVAPNCIKMTCICYSLALCVQHAFEKLPSSLGFLLAEIPKWFSKSTICREVYKTLYELMSPDNDQAPPFEKYSKTRWLVRGKVIFKILMNWGELKAYFMVAQPASTQSARYKAHLLLDMLKDPTILLYFHFASPLVTEFKRVNAFFQATESGS
ncbi:zinc finger MYM-type 6-like [Paramuricea clavata]|uniref:Zinc finger MYM-type 6-like n=1 Tax=Paramuricea clavata TaxID=317549 RepID=A0A6S7H7H1_PARCT|nr:zinc finger MYM-type 6-like [Paramuricea clavata]